MSVPTVSWDETSPDGAQAISLGDNRIREMKTQLREIVGVDHDFPSSGQDAGNGQHLQVTLQEQADLGTGAEGATILGSQTVSGKGELVYTDEDDNDIQITAGGILNACNLAGNQTVAGVKTFSSFPVTPSSAPTTDYQVANKKYVDDSVPSAFESGMIMIWSGAISAIPSGWVLCDGNNSTPDLREKFVIGARSDSGAGAGQVDVGDNGGQSLAGTDDSITMATAAAGGGSNPSNGGGTSYTESSHTHNAMPPYYALAYIMYS